jgi:hypothetical protein
VAVLALKDLLEYLSSKLEMEGDSSKLPSAFQP